MKSLPLLGNEMYRDANLNIQRFLMLIVKMLEQEAAKLVLLFFYLLVSPHNMRACLRNKQFHDIQ